MYEIDYKNTVKNYTVGIIFFVVGLILFIVFSIFAFSGPIKKASMDQETIATKVESNCRYDNEGDYMCSPIYYFEVKGKSYECQSSFSSSTIPSSDNNKVYYRSNNPSNCVTDYEANTSIILYLFMLLPLIFIIMGLINIVKLIKKIKRLKKLANEGVLIKNLPYTMESSNISLNGRALKQIVIEYNTPKGETLHLKSDARFDHKEIDTDGAVDLLIDPNDYTNYYIDFNIYQK